MYQMYVFLLGSRSSDAKVTSTANMVVLIVIMVKLVQLVRIVVPLLAFKVVKLLLMARPLIV